jgi:hypothetical protein
MKKLLAIVKAKNAISKADLFVAAKPLGLADQVVSNGMATLIRLGYVGYVHNVYTFITETPEPVKRETKPKNADTIDLGAKSLFTGKKGEGMSETVIQEGTPIRGNGDMLNESIEHIRSDWHNLIPHGLEAYVEQGSEMEDLEIILNADKPVLILGPKGTGKSLLPRKVAEKHSIPVFTFNCSLGATEEDMIGQFSDLGKFVDGIITQAIKCAKENGVAMLIMEEINAMVAGVTMVLHPL